MSSDVSGVRSATGRLFHTAGPLTRKLRSLYVAGNFIRSVSGTGNWHPIAMDRIPAVAMNGWHVARHWAAGDGGGYRTASSVKMASTFKRLVIWRLDFLFLELEV